MQRVFSFFLAACLGLATASLSAQAGAASSVIETGEIRAELLADAPQGVASGSKVWLGLQLRHQPGWHSYWKNSGDSGLPTTLEWTLPKGVQASDIAWPVPKKLRLGPLVNYGYEGTVLLPVQLNIGPDFKPPLFGADLAIKLRAVWLVCKTACIPQEGEFALKLPIRSSTAMHSTLFDAAWGAQPRALDDVGAGSRADVSERSIRVTVSGLPLAWQGKALEVFAETPELIDHPAAVAQRWAADVWSAELALSPQRSNAPSILPLVLVSDGQGRRVEAKVFGEWPKVAAPTAVSPALAAALRANAAGQSAENSRLGWAAALLGALLGGLILNLMPCVFPVLAIKVAGFARHAHDQRRQRIGGICYSLGVVSSFMLLGLALLALRAAGQSVGWGFQLQEPWVVASLALLFTLIGLNLAGLFEFGSILPSSLATLEAKHPALNAFLTGVLAVAVASPCTAPFMGASVGFAIDLPAPQAMAIFASLGLGLALPYLLACFIPAFARSLPQPGAWMQTLRRLLAFPMFATVAWLVWVLGQQSGIDGVGALLLLLVLLSAVLWAFTLRGSTRTRVAALTLGLAGLGAWAVGPAIGEVEPSRPEALQDERWLPWEPGRVEQILASGQPVFVDFTAAWCVTCQYNKRVVLNDETVLAELATKKVVLLRADWTRRDPAITAALAQLGRSGVPVYVFYRKGSPPTVLSEILGVEEVRSVIAKL